MQNQSQGDFITPSTNPNIYSNELSLRQVTLNEINKTWMIHPSEIPYMNYVPK